MDSTSPDPTSGLAAPAFPLEDMRLLHHWLIKTAPSMHLESRSRVWAGPLTEIAFNHHFLLHGILAVAAIHNVYSVPGVDRQSLLLQADKHISIALSTYRNLLESPTLETSIPVFALASLLVTYNLASAHIEEPEDPIAAIHHCFMLLQGVKIVILPYWAHIQENPVFAEM
jgi:hypothetical protein